MRIVSLLPSATEILFGLGFDHEIVGVSHECDFPLRARTKTPVIHSRIPKDAPPGEIDRLVRDYISRGESRYEVDAEILQDLSPDLIITQDLCHVCAASPDDLTTALAKFRRRPELLCLNPRDLRDVWRDILWVGEQTDRSPRAEEIIRMIGERIGELGIMVDAIKSRPRVVLLEWLQPLYVGGHWVPEMIEHAGGLDVIGKAKTPSFRVSEEEIIAAAPDIMIVAPCGYNKGHSRDEYLSMAFSPKWGSIPAVRNGRVYAMDAKSYVSRPGPRLVTGMEAMAKAIHPYLRVRAGAEAAILPIHRGTRNTQTASA
ncbi:MAG TPA: cobalamin-binding protein [Candidatus Acidoferrum sp.]|nr:cobalamin-binding protein [Candidatus Acidoferrum sp.]